MSVGRFALAFDSTHAAMAANRALAHLAPVMIPTPPSISAGCGMTLCFEAAGDEEACALAGEIADARGLATLYAEDAEGHRFVAKL